MASGPTTTLVATGCSSGLGYATLRLLLAAPPPAPRYRLLLGCRDPTSSQLQLLSKLAADGGHTLQLFQLDLTSFASVRQFASEVTGALGQGGIDMLLLCAGVYKATPTLQAGGWSEEAITNHFSQHYLLHLLHKTLGRTPSSRLVIVSSALQFSVKSLESLRPLLRCETPTAAQETRPRYAASKFVQMIGARYWKQTLAGKTQVLAVSPGFVPQTGLTRETSWLGKLFLWYILPWAPFCATVEQGAHGIERAIVLPSSEIDALSAELSEGTVLYLNNKGDVTQPDVRTAESGLDVWLPDVAEMDTWT